jgi:hypothetical protein
LRRRFETVGLEQQERAHFMRHMHERPGVGQQVQEQREEGRVMFHEWVAHGAEIGTVAFFALVVFALYCAAVLGLIGILSRVAKGGEYDAEERRRPY